MCKRIHTIHYSLTWPPPEARSDIVSPQNTTLSKEFKCSRSDTNFPQALIKASFKNLKEHLPNKGKSQKKFWHQNNTPPFFHKTPPRIARSVKHMTQLKMAPKRSTNGANDKKDGPLDA